MKMGPLSRPVWGAWIEIPLQDTVYPERGGRAPYGARGLKLAQGHPSPQKKVAPRMGRVD